MQSRPASYFVYPQLVNNQLQKADPGTAAAQAIQDEFDDYWTLIVQYCVDDSRIIEKEIQRTFVPYRAAKDYYFRDEIRNGHFGWNRSFGGYYLDLDEDLLAVDTIVFNDTTLTSSQFRLVGIDDSTSTYPFFRVLFDTTSSISIDTDFDSKITITGEWGVQDNVNDAYSDVTTITAAMADTTVTTVTVADGDGDLFFQYQYIRIDDELMLITAITGNDASPDTLTVVRGVNGFTAATHDTGSTIERWNVVGDVQKLAQRMVAYWFNKRDDKGDRVEIIGDALILAQFSSEIAAIAKRRKRSLVGAV